MRKGLSQILVEGLMADALDPCRPPFVLMVGVAECPQPPTGLDVSLGKGGLVLVDVQKKALSIGNQGGKVRQHKLLFAEYIGLGGLALGQWSFDCYRRLAFR